MSKGKSNNKSKSNSNSNGFLISKNQTSRFSAKSRASLTRTLYVSLTTRQGYRGWPIQAVLWLEWGSAAAVDTKLETSAHTLQCSLEQFRNSHRERRTAMVAAERHEVSLAGRVKSFQAPRHDLSLRPRTAPLKPKAA